MAMIIEKIREGKAKFGFQIPNLGILFHFMRNSTASSISLIILRIVSSVTVAPISSVSLTRPPISIPGVKLRATRKTFGKGESYG